MKISMDKKYTTRDGKPVRLFCTDLHTPKYPVIGAVKYDFFEDTLSWTLEGNFFEDKESDRDLIEVKETKRMQVLFVVRKGQLLYHNMYETDDEVNVALQKIEGEHVVIREVEYEVS